MSARFPALNLPAAPLRIEVREGKTQVFDPVRKRFVVLSPEEWIRQHIVHYLITQAAYPRSLMAVETALPVAGTLRRTDIVVYDREGQVFLLVECKAADVPISQTTALQVAQYNQALRARYVLLSNGLVSYCLQADYTTAQYHFLEAIPKFE